MSQQNNRFKILFFVGAVILVIGLIFQWYPTSVIEGLTQRLKESNLSQDEINKLQGALNSWKVWQLTTFQPLSSILFSVGIIIIVYAVVSGAFFVASSYKVVKKSEKE